MEKAYSINDEEFNFDDPWDAMDELNRAGNLVEGAVYYEIDTKRVDPLEFLRAERILEEAEERLYDAIGEAAEDFYSVTTGAAAELDALLGEWAKKHLSDRHAWRCVGKSRELKVTAEDVASHAS